jgi:hypothetical protein
MALCSSVNNETLHFVAVTCRFEKPHIHAHTLSRASSKFQYDSDRSLVLIRLRLVTVEIGDTRHFEAVHRTVQAHHVVGGAVVFRSW